MPVYERASKACHSKVLSSPFQRRNVARQQCNSNHYYARTNPNPRSCITSLPQKKKRKREIRQLCKIRNQFLSSRKSLLLATIEFVASPERDYFLAFLFTLLTGFSQSTIVVQVIPSLRLSKRVRSTEVTSSRHKHQPQG
ncbi:hypothetical protein DM02DRAFT_48171 [Periconia macrospinosa]|uniref:Uncharacterized protein n=1 Tax=Periconia macrospinosa TaxID=97972 RepID=A0A2V1DJX5_9PLEO|nr:hypothetical protein DM02DRAFT_48171 [Periconia macrospinosa]